MLAGPSGLSPHVKLGVSIEDAFGGRAPAAAELRKLGGIYARERYWLLWRGGRGFALMCEDFVPADVLRLLWQVRSEYRVSTITILLYVRTYRALAPGPLGKEGLLVTSV